MTAVVGILNKQAIALAADSAVTISAANGNKIFNRANKVFTLSKYHPVGIMLYNSATFLSTPWETIIKIYRKQLGKKSFPHIEDYKNDFLNHLNSKDYYADEQTQQYFLAMYFKGTLDMLIDDSVKNRKDLFVEPNEDKRNEIIRLIDEKAEEYIPTFSNGKHCPEMIALTFQDYLDYANPLIDPLLKEAFLDNMFNLSDDTILKIKTFLYHTLRFQENKTNFTGLIFVGFGEDEIYPKLLPINISFVFNGRLRYYVDESNCGEINVNRDSAICPFAQTDVIDTILTGVDPSLESAYLNNFKEAFIKYNNEILKIATEENANILKAQIEAFNIDDIVNEYAKKVDDAKIKNYIYPLMNAVGSLSKEDLAEMAESLIYLTYLKRRITFAEESVGGPVDVAVISKGDGFIWIKRKHYFKPELNRYFFDNYFNH